MSKSTEYKFSDLVNLSELKGKTYSKTFVINNIEVLEKEDNTFSFTMVIRHHADILNNFRIKSSPLDSVNGTIEFNDISSSIPIEKQTLLMYCLPYCEVKIRFSFTSRDVKEVTLLYDEYDVDQPLRNKLINNTILIDKYEYKDGDISSVKS